MTDKAYHASEVDTDVIAQVLHDLADDIEEGGVLVESHKSFVEVADSRGIREFATEQTAHGVEVESDDAVSAGIALEFIPKVGSRSVGNFAQQYEENETIAEVIRE